ncbi:hypothetical protein DU002_13030 [Corallincola holothuriorum]|uniref:Uncharacterized protein n=1 Tax=Corallincola holothuriorum TaxID=2282215 RepID=A0A368NGD0_9GAMM|nr:hypothetical protein [Corallincola holothuriorum]RCU49266.1 hypothetical protein DU002_13030 [Corallincola holothuriorum]
MIRYVLLSLLVSSSVGTAYAQAQYPMLKDAYYKSAKSTISPAANSTLTSNSETFSWDHPGGYYYISAGTSKGGTDIYDSDSYFQEKSYTLDGLPDSGSVYVRIYYYDWDASQWQYEDYSYSMDVGGNSSSPITPNAGSTLTSNSVTLSWTNDSGYYWLDVGSSVGGADIFESESAIRQQSTTISNLPNSGTIYVRLWSYQNSAWEYEDYTYNMNANGDTGGGGSMDDTIITSSVYDDLDPDDKNIFANAMRGQGYEWVLDDDNVSSAELTDYLGREAKLLYHTGHGFTGYISTSDGGWYSSYIDKVAIENTVIATCLTVGDRDWKSKFVGTTQNIMGYNNNSYDFTDNEVARDLANGIESGKSYPQIWYEINNKQSSLYDRWVIYTKDNDRVVTYEADVANARTKTNDTFTPFANGKVLVASSITKAAKRGISFENAHFNVQKDFEEQQSHRDMISLSLSSLSEDAAIQMATQWVEDKASFDGVEFDRVTSISADGKRIGYQVRFKRVVDSLAVRSNTVSDYISLLIDESGIAASEYNWSLLKKRAQKGSLEILSVKQAIEAAADDIAAFYKSTETIKFVSAEPCLGYKETNASTQILVPAYEFSSTDGSSVIIDAATGEIL